MLQGSFNAAAEDKYARALAEAKVDAESLLLAIKAALAQDGDLLNAEEKAKISAKMDALTNLTLETNIHAPSKAGLAEDIHAATEALNLATEAFAAKRMDASVSRALAGRDVNELNL
jgi:molecular chaperone HscA